MTISVTIKRKKSEKSYFYARFYLIVALPILIFLCFAIPPFEASDEASHFLRVNALSQGGILPAVNLHDTRIGGAEKSAGGMVDPAVRDLIDAYPLQKHRTYRTTPKLVEDLMARRATGQLTYVAHSNTAIYPPMLYSMPVVGVAVARALDLPILGWLYLARVANALAGAALIFWALRQSGDAAPFLLIGATLPLVLFQQSTVSADAALFPLFIAFAALLKRLSAGDIWTNTDTVALCVTTFFICVGKIAYLPLALLPLILSYLSSARWTGRSTAFLTAIVISFVVWALWASIIRDKVFTIIPGIPVDPKQQLLGILHAPGHAGLVFAKSMISQLPRLTVGLTGSRLGWMDFIMPKPFIYCSVFLFVSSIFVSPEPDARSRFALPTVAFFAVGCYFIIYFLLYLQFNLVGGSEIKGVEGRYMTPLLLIVGVMVTRRAPSATLTRKLVPFLYVWVGVSCAVTAAMTMSHYWSIS